MGYVLWGALILLAWWWGTNPAGRTRQDRDDLRRVRDGFPRCLR
jgi:hypothetical protein